MLDRNHSNQQLLEGPTTTNNNSHSQKQLIAVGGGHISEHDESAEGTSPTQFNNPNNMMIAGGDGGTSQATLGGAVESPTSKSKKQSNQRMTSMEDFDISSKLGDGAYSSVYRVKRIADGEIYALKKVKLHHLSDKEKDNAINEVRILASLRNPNIIQYKEAFVETQTQSLCIVMEYADNGDLFQKIQDHQKNKTAFTEQEIWKIFIQIVRGLKAMHDLNIMHRDLKSANVFLNRDFTAKLGDMNVSKVANKRGLNYTQTGTPYYASPEVWRDEPYDIKSDIWSLGCVLYEMVALKPPFTAEDMQGLYKKVLKGHFPRIPKTYSHDLWTMCKTLIQVTAQSRPNCEQIMNFPTFAKKFEKYFPEDHQAYFNEQQNILLKTIKFPKNLMYLSDRLPKQNYKNHNFFAVSQEESSLQNLVNGPLQGTIEMMVNGQLASHRHSRKNLQAAQVMLGNMSPINQLIINQKNSQSQIQQPTKELRLPSISNIKQQQYMNQISLGGANGISGLASSINRGSYGSPIPGGASILTGGDETLNSSVDYSQQYVYKKKTSDGRSQMPSQSIIQKSSKRSNNQISIIKMPGMADAEFDGGDTVNYNRSNSTLADDSLEITHVQPQIRPGRQILINHALNKKSSIQVSGSLEILSEEGHMSKQTDKSMEGLPLMHSPSEKRYKYHHHQIQLHHDGTGQGILPSLTNERDGDNASISSNRHASPVLLKTQASKKLKVMNNHNASISQDYSQKRLLSLNQQAQIQRVAGIYNVHTVASRALQPVSQRDKQLQKDLRNQAAQQQQFLINSKDGLAQRLSPQVQMSLDSNNASLSNIMIDDRNLPGLSSERIKATSPHRVQELINRYNLNNLKMNLKAATSSQPEIMALNGSGGVSIANRPRYKNLHGGDLSYSIGGSLGEKTLLQSNSKNDLILAIQQGPPTIVHDSIIAAGSQRGHPAIRNSKIKKTRNNNSKSIVVTQGPVQHEPDTSVTSIMAAATRITNNKTTVEQQQELQMIAQTIQGRKAGASPLKNSQIVLPSIIGGGSQTIEQGKFTMVPYDHGGASPQRIMMGKIQQQQNYSSINHAVSPSPHQQQQQLQGGSHHRAGKKTQRLHQQQLQQQQPIPGYPYLQVLPRNKSNYGEGGVLRDHPSNGSNLNNSIIIATSGGPKELQ